MDWLNRAYVQAADLFRSMTPATRVIAGMLLVVIVVSITYLVRLQTSAGGEYLLGARAFSDSELTAMEAAFAKAGLSGWEVRDQRIRVPRGQKAAFMAALVEGDALPASFGSYFSKLAEGSSLFTDRARREAEMKAATERELALIFRSMKGIDEASVRYDEVVQGGLRRTKEKTALVSVRAEGNRPLSEEEVRSIRNAMAAAVAGLERRNITVLDLNSKQAHTLADLDDPESGGALYVKTQAEYEAYYRDKIYAKLAMIPGVVVGVNVTLDPKKRHQVTELTYGGQPHVVQSSELTREKSSSQGGAGGRVGAAPNGVGNSPASVSPSGLAATQNTETETRGEQANLLDQTTTLSEEAPFVPKRVTASVSVPRSYYVQIWRERNPAEPDQPPATPPAADLQAIELEVQKRLETDVVQLLPPLPAGEDMYPLVTVTTYDDLTPPPEPSPSLAETTFTWLSANWGALAMLAVALGSLLMLRNTLRTLPSPPPQAGAAAAPVGQETAPGEAEAEATPPRKLKRRFRSTGEDLRAELVELVREDPDAAANVLRSWIGDAA